MQVRISQFACRLAIVSVLVVAGKTASAQMIAPDTSLRASSLPLSAVTRPHGVTAPASDSLPPVLRPAAVTRAPAPTPAPMDAGRVYTITKRVVLVAAIIVGIVLIYNSTKGSGSGGGGY